MKVPGTPGNRGFRGLLGDFQMNSRLFLVDFQILMRFLFLDASLYIQSVHICVYIQVIFRCILCIQYIQAIFRQIIRYFQLIFRASRNFQFQIASLYIQNRIKTHFQSGFTWFFLGSYRNISYIISRNGSDQAIFRQNAVDFQITLRRYIYRTESKPHFQTVQCGFGLRPYIQRIEQIRI